MVIQTQNPAIISLFVYEAISVSESLVELMPATNNAEATVGVTDQLLTTPDDALRYLARILVSESLQRHKQRYANTA